MWTVRLLSGFFIMKNLYHKIQKVYKALDHINHDSELIDLMQQILRKTEELKLKGLIVDSHSRYEYLMTKIYNELKEEYGNKN